MLPRFDFPIVSHIEIRAGEARLAGRNLKVKMVVSRLIHGTGATMDEVMEQYNLSQAEVHACLAYYFDHKREFDKAFAEEDRIVAENVPSIDDLKARLNWQEHRPNEL